MIFQNSKKYYLIIGLLLISSTLHSKQVEIKSENIGSSFIVDLAISDEEKKKGLMFVSKLHNTNGMLFVYDTPQIVNMWMKNTLLDLDLIFITKNNIISSVKSGKKLSETIISSKEPVVAVLEIPTSCNRKVKLKVGYKLKWKEKKTVSKKKKEKNKLSLFPCLE